MLAADERIPFTCGSCSRSFTLTLQSLAKRRVCSYCGKPLQLTAAVEKALATGAAAAAAKSEEPSQRGPPVAVECPICGRIARVKRALEGQRTECLFCRCPYIVPSQDGPAAAAPSNDALPRLHLGEICPLRPPCPKCGAAKLNASNLVGTQGVCTACKSLLDCYTLPLEAFTDLEPGHERTQTVRFAREALRVRWHLRELGLVEAVKLFEAMEAIDAWSRTINAPASPFDPEYTLEIVQWAILYEPQAAHFKEQNAPGIDVEIKEDAAEDSQLTAGGMLKGTKQEIAAASKKMFRAMTSGRMGDDVSTLRLVFLAVPGGTDVRITVRHSRPIDPKKQPREAEVRETADAEMVAWVRKALIDAMPAAARQFLAFRSVMGIWTSGSMFHAATEHGVQRRLETLGGTFAKNAAASAKVLTQHRAFGA